MSEPLKLHPLARRDRLVLTLSAVLVVAVTAFAYLREARPEWKGYQAAFAALVGEKLGPERAAKLERGLQQTWVPALGVTDRCLSCHQGLNWKGLDGAPQPFSAHPQDILRTHPVERFGCTPCHGGQGWATSAREAHALDLAESEWAEPLLAGAVEKDYLLDKGALVQVRCNSCHRYNQTTAGMDLINRGKELIREKGCRACHLINGRGGAIGPDLSNEGDKLAEQFNYERVSGVKSALAWQVGHFRDPKTYVAETVMPNFHFTTREAQSLALLVMSWRKAELPSAYLAGAPRRDEPTAAELEEEKAMTTGEGAFFAKKGCWTCHSIAAYGIQSPTNIGPDLSTAYADVQSRFGRTLQDFLVKPTGTMEVVLSRQILLSDAERAEAIRLLTLAYERTKTPSTATDTTGHKPVAPEGARPKAAPGR